MGCLSFVEELLGHRRLVAPFPQLVKKISPVSTWSIPNEIAESPGVRAVIVWLRQEAERSRSTLEPLECCVDVRETEPDLIATAYPQVYGGTNCRLSR